ncbi:MAG: dihydroorotase [Candidatus Pacebacteria bacterium]|nr:dihydroorotase [Candidatus Paceibacterota bacterium]
MTLQHFSIARPADMHCHFRQGDMMHLVVPASAKDFGYVTVMPNTSPPITSVEQCRSYLADIVKAAGPFATQAGFQPLGTAYICEGLDPDELRRGFEEKVWFAAKLYPQGGTTGSEHAASSLQSVYPLFEVMQEIGMPLLIHGEVVGPKFDEYSRWDRERIFSEMVLPELSRTFPKLKKVCEHVSTRELIQKVWRDESGYLAATITPHHALFTDGDVSRGGVFTDANCMPIIKSPTDRAAIQQAMLSGDERFFAGTDSAPHDSSKKYARCCSFGAYVAPGAVMAYASVFEQHQAFEQDNGVLRFEKFMSLNGPKFYGLPPSTHRITMVRSKKEHKISDRFVIPGKKILEPDTEVVSLFHHELGLAPQFFWTPEQVN